MVIHRLITLFERKVNALDKMLATSETDPDRSGQAATSGIVGSVPGGAVSRSANPHYS